MELIKRRDAIAKGLKWYFTGNPCPHGHIAKRYVGNGTCFECSNVKSIAYQTNNRDKANAAVQKHYYRNLQEQRTRCREKADLSSIMANRHARAQRMPKWADKKSIRAVYLKAKELSKSSGLIYHVDHVVPLRGRFVSGLHVHQNLQILPAQENLKKHNTWQL